MRERPVRFGRSRSLVGVVTEPSPSAADPRRPGVVLLDAGVVHRVGPNRLHVKVARRLASAGHRVLRFDFSGIGDSPPRRDALPLEESAVIETREAMDCLDAPRVVLAAICSGAAFSVRTALADRRVAGVVLINAAGHRWASEEELSRTMLHHYRRMATFGPSRGRVLRKLATLDFDAGAVLNTVWRRVRASLRRASPEPPAAPGHAEALRSLVDRGVRVLMVYSESDEGLDYYRLHLEDRLRGLGPDGRLAVRVLPGANHTFTLLAHQRALLETVEGWISGVAPDPPCPSPDSRVRHPDAPPEPTAEEASHAP